MPTVIWFLVEEGRIKRYRYVYILTVLGFLYLTHVKIQNKGHIVL